MNLVGNCWRGWDSYPTNWLPIAKNVQDILMLLFITEAWKYMLCRGHSLGMHVKFLDTCAYATWACTLIILSKSRTFFVCQPYLYLHINACTLKYYSYQLHILHIYVSVHYGSNICFLLWCLTNQLRSKGPTFKSTSSTHMQFYHS